MANIEHLQKFAEGVELWNEWRKDNVDLEVDLSDARLSARQHFPWEYTDELFIDNVMFDAPDWVGMPGINLSYVNLRGAYLEHGYLMKADLTHANLSRTKLSGIHLSGADLSGANLCDADLSNADLRKRFKSHVATILSMRRMLAM